MTQPCLRVIEDHERPALEALGAELRVERLRAGYNRPAFAKVVQLSPRHLSRLESGERRTRASTLLRIASALTERLDVDRDTLHAQLLALGGEAIAPESSYPERVESRRLARLAKATKREQRRQEQELLERRARGFGRPYRRRQ